MKLCEFLWIFGSFCLISLQLYSCQSYFTEKQKKIIIQQHKQRLAQEAMKMFENQFQMDPINTNNKQQSAAMFNQMINYKGLYENLDIRNVSLRLISDKFINENQPLIGLDYKRHHNHHYLVYFFNHSFIVTTFHLDHFQNLVYDKDSSMNNRVKVSGQLIQMKFYRQYDSDQLFLAALIFNGLYEIRLYEVQDGARIIDKELLHTFKIHERVVAIDIVHFDRNKYRIVTLIDSGWKQLDEFQLEIHTVDDKNDNPVICLTAQNALHIRTLRIQTQGFIVVSNTTHWAVYRYHDRMTEMVNFFRMQYFIRDVQLFSNGHRYYVGIATHNEQYIYQWKDGKQGFQGVARMRLPIVYKMNSITLSYSREDNFFYFDQLNQDIIRIYGYDITNSAFLLLRTLSKSKDLKLSSNVVFHPIYSVSFYDRNFAFELKLTTKSELYFFTYETLISHSGGKNTRKTSESNLYNLQRYNKQLYEKKIEQMTKKVFQLDQQQTISKLAVNLTFNFNVTFRANVRVKRYQINDAKMAKKIYINRRDYAMNELNIASNIIKKHLQHIVYRMDRLKQKLTNDVVYRNQNVNIIGQKHFIKSFSARKIYTKQAFITTYNGKSIDEIMSNIYRIGKHNGRRISGRKFFTSNFWADKSISINNVNNVDFSDFLYTDLDQDVYANYWYPNQIYVDNLLISNFIASNISLSEAIFINQDDYQQIMIRNKLVFDSISVDNLYVDTIDNIRIVDFPKQVLTKHHSGYIQQVKIPTKIDKLKVKSDIFVKFINEQNTTDLFGNIIRRNQNIRFISPVQILSDVTMNFINVQGKINNVRIPDDLVDRHSEQIIHGVKRFSSINVDNINVTYLNHLQIPVDIVTLTGDNEIIERDLQIDRLIVDGNLHVNGLFDGVNLTHLDRRYLDSFKNVYQNLTFLSPVNVTKLTIISEQINDIDSLDQLYSNVYFKSERSLKISSAKTIDNIFRCNALHANIVNSNSVQDFVTLHQPKHFSNKVIFKNGTYFDHIKLNNKIDNVLVDDLINDVVTLTGFQTLNGDKKFLNEIRISGHLKIDGKINDQFSPENWLRYSTMQNISSPINFVAPIYCGMLIIDGNIETETVNGENLKEKTSNLLMLNQPISLNAFVHCINCSASNIQTTFINGKNFIEFSENYLSKSKYQVINGSKNFIALQRFRNIRSTKTVAGIDLKTLKYQAITNNGYNIITRPVIIHGNLTIQQGQLFVRQWNGINFESFIHELVLRNINEKIQIQGDIIYYGNVDLMADIHVYKLNNYVPENVIMTNNRNYTIYNNVRFNERLIASKNLTVVGVINLVNLTELNANVLKKNHHGELIVENNHNDVINFVDSIKIDEIIIEGNVDNQTINKDSILMSNGEQNIKKLIIDGGQWFNKSINILSNINHLDKDYLKKIILINSPEEQHIDYHKTFAKINVNEIYHENGLINFNVINSIDINHFNSTALYSDNNQIIKNYPYIKFSNNITVNNPRFKILGLINNVDIGDVVRLDSQRQIITGKKIFDSIVFNENIDVDGYLNAQLDIPKLSKQMLLVYGNQHIKTPITFVAPVFLMNNNSVDLLNQYHPGDLITLYGDKITNGPALNFNNVIAKKVYVQNHLVNNVNLTDIYQHGFMAESLEQDEQIFGFLSIDKAQFIENITVDKHLNDLDLSKTIESIESKFDSKIDAQKMTQKLYEYQLFMNEHKYYYEQSNLEIDYFHQTNQMSSILNDWTMESLDFQQRFKVFNVSVTANLFNSLYERKHLLWQSIIVRHRIFVAELWPAKQSVQLFRLISFEPNNGQSLIILEKNLKSGSKPFLFTMDHFIYVIYFDSNHHIDDCYENYETKLFRLDIDYNRSNQTHVFIQNFQLEKISNIGHYIQHETTLYNVHYLVFNIINIDPMIRIYQRIKNDCHFRLFQTIPLAEPVHSISLFSMGITNSLMEPFMILMSDSYLYIWKQEGIQGFIKNWTIIIKGSGHQTSNRRVQPFIYSKNRLLLRIQITACDDEIVKNSYLEARFNPQFQTDYTNLILFQHDSV